MQSVLELITSMVTSDGNSGVPKGPLFLFELSNLLSKTDCALFGANTSKQKEEAEGDLLPGFQNKGLEYFSPIVKVRQEFNLHTNLRPCKAFPAIPLNYQDDIDIKLMLEWLGESGYAQRIEKAVAAVI